MKRGTTCILIHYSRCSHVHVRSAGSGVHLPFDAQVAVILVDGTTDVLHLKTISAPSLVFWNVSIKPFTGTTGSPQLTGKEEEELGNTQIWYCCYTFANKYITVSPWERPYSQKWTCYVKFFFLQCVLGFLGGEAWGWGYIRSYLLKKAVLSVIIWMVKCPSCLAQDDEGWEKHSFAANNFRAILMGMSDNEILPLPPKIKEIPSTRLKIYKS